MSFGGFQSLSQCKEWATCKNLGMCDYCKKGLNNQANNVLMKPKKLTDWYKPITSIK